MTELPNHIVDSNRERGISWALGGFFSGLAIAVTSLALKSIQPLLFGSIPIELMLIRSLFLIKDNHLNNNLQPLISALALATLFSGGALATHFALGTQDPGLTYIFGWGAWALAASPLLGCKEIAERERPQHSNNSLK
jgi:hypothetical protein